MLSGHVQHLATVKATVETNHLFVKTIVDKAAGMFENDPSITIPSPVESFTIHTLYHIARPLYASQ